MLATIIVFNVLVIIYQILIEVFSSLFIIDGIQIDKAKFQIISILTGTGFTTHESELMLMTKRRRKMTQVIMLFSYIFNISIVSTIVNVFISYGNTNLLEVSIGIGLTLLNFILLLVLYKSNHMRKKFEEFIKRTAMTAREKRKSIISIYDTYGNKVIAEVEVIKLKYGMKTKNIAQLELKNKYQIQILVVKRGEELLSEITSDFVIKEGDILVVFGKLKEIKKLFCKEIQEKDKINQ